MKKQMVLILMIMLMLVSVQNGYCDEDEADYEFSYGLLASESGSQISLVEQNYTTGEEEVVTYYKDEQTEFEGIESFGQLEIGDEVELLFEMREGRRVAVVISKSAVEIEEQEDDYQIENVQDTDESFDSQG